MIERVTVVKFRMNDGGGNGDGCFEVTVRTDTAKFTDVIVARFRKCGDLVREGKVFVKITKIKPRLRSEWVVVREQSCILELLFKSNKKKFSFRRVESNKIGSHPRRDVVEHFVSD